MKTANDINYTLCPSCNGSGEGMMDGTKCRACHGSGSEPHGYTCPECGQITDTDYGPCPDCANKTQEELP